MANENAITKIQLKTKTSPDGSYLWVKLSAQPGDGKTYTLTPTPDPSISITNTAWAKMSARGIYTFETDDAKLKLYYSINDTEPTDDYQEYSSPINFNPLYAAIKDLDRGEALVNTNNNTLIVQTTKGGDNPIIVGQSTVKFDNTLPADKIKNSADIVSFDAAFERSRKHISGNNNIKVSNNNGNLQVSYTDYSSKLHFEDCELQSPGSDKPYTGYKVTGVDNDHNGRLVIPSTYNGKKVICVDFNPNSYSKEITSISIPDSVKVIKFLEAVEETDNATEAASDTGDPLSKITSLKIPNSVLEVTGAFPTSLTSISIPAQLVGSVTVNSSVSTQGILEKVNHIIITNVTHTSTSTLNLSGWEIDRECTLTISGDSVDCGKLTLPSNLFAKLVLDCTDIIETSGKGLGAITNLSKCTTLAFSHRVKTIPGRSYIDIITGITIDKLPMSIETIGRGAFSFLPSKDPSTGKAISITFTNGQPLCFKPFHSIANDTYMIAALGVPKAGEGTLAISIPKSVKYIAPECFDEKATVNVDLHQDNNWDPSWAGFAKVTYNIPKNLEVTDSIVTSSFRANSIQAADIIESAGSGIGIKAAHGIQAEYFNATSDARLKENFKEYTPEKSILDLPVYKFDFINGAKNQIGCKAQDLQEICPEIVNEGSDGYLSIQESKIVC